MKFAILGGGGAMGGLFGGGLAAAGHEVSLIDVAPAAISAINGAGLKIEEKSGETRSVKVRATDDPASVGPVDAVLNFVKCYHTEAAVRAAAPMIGPDTAVLTLQNGWGNAETISGIVGRERVLVGLTYHSGVLAGPGHVKHPGIGMTYVGELSGETTPRLEALAAALRSAGFEVTPSTSILDEIWKKLALNCCTLPTSALLGLFSHELAAIAPMRDEMRAILAEVKAVAGAQGIALDEEERWGTIIGILERGVGGKSSMLQDVEAGRRTEIDVINGAIVAAGQKTGVATPHNAAMVNLVRGWEGKLAARRAAEAKP
jgi:2-dehydropantoate 2-reductase